MGPDGVVTVNGSLDYEAVGGDSHDITVLATSDDGSSSSKSFTISVTDDRMSMTSRHFGHQ